MMLENPKEKKGKRLATYEQQHKHQIVCLFSDVDVEAMISCRTLESVNLEENPLSREVSEAMANINNIRITITPREVEEWEDLSL